MKTEIVTMTCDYEGCEQIDAIDTRFSAFGGDYAIDLCHTHRSILIELVRPYAESGRKVKRANLHITPKAKAKPVLPADDKPKVQTERRKRPTQPAKEAAE